MNYNKCLTLILVFAQVFAKMSFLSLSEVERARDIRKLIMPRKLDTGEFRKEPWAWLNYTSSLFLFQMALQGTVCRMATADSPALCMPQDPADVTT